MQWRFSIKALFFLRRQTDRPLSCEWSGTSCKSSGWLPRQHQHFWGCVHPSSLAPIGFSIYPCDVVSGLRSFFSNLGNVGAQRQKISYYVDASFWPALEEGGRDFISLNKIWDKEDYLWPLSMVSTVGQTHTVLACFEGCCYLKGHLLLWFHSIDLNRTHGIALATRDITLPFVTHGLL